MAENDNNRDRGSMSVEEAGRKGGHSQGKENSPGNFANRDPEDVREAASKGGHSQGKDDNSGNFANRQ